MKRDINKPSIEFTINGDIYDIQIDYWERYIPPYVWGHPDGWGPSEGGWGEFSIWDGDIRMTELEADTSAYDEDEIQERMFIIMEMSDES